MIDQPDDSVAVNGGRNRLPKLNPPEPLLFPENSGKLLRTNIIQIKKEEVIFEPRSQIVEPITSCAPVLLQRRIIISAHVTNHIHVPGLKTNHLCIFRRNNEKGDFIQVRKTVLPGIRLPVKRVPLQHNLLARRVPFQSKRTQPRNFTGIHGHIPGLRDLSFLVRTLKQVSWKNAYTVEEPLGSSIGLGQLEEIGRAHV